MYTFHTVEKSDQELLKVSNFANSMILPESKICINMSTTWPIPNRSLAEWGPKDWYYGVFPVYLHLIKFLLTSNRWFLVVEGYLPQPVSRMHFVMYIMNTLSFAEIVGSLYWRLQKLHVWPREGINRCTPLFRYLYLSSSLELEFQIIPSTSSITP